MWYDWLRKIEFSYPWVLVGIAALPVIAWLYHSNQRKIHSSILVSSSSAFIRRGSKTGSLHLPFYFRLVALLFCIIALARPRIEEVITRSKGEGIDIILCIDVSGSMRSADFTPNRLEVAKEIAAEFVDNRPVDQIGLVVFAGEPFTQSPLSTDHVALKEHIAGLRSNMLGDGTVIGEGLATAVDRLSASGSRSKVIILLTDGREQAPDNRLIDPVTALEIARAKGVKVYTIGMGASTAVVFTDRGRSVVSGDYFLDEALLQRIATQTGGAYFRATNRERLEGIYQQIDQMEKSEVEVISRTRYQELFVYVMLAALFFLLLEIFLRFTVYRTFP